MINDMLKSLAGTAPRGNCTEMRRETFLSPRNGKNDSDTKVGGERGEKDRQAGCRAEKRETRAGGVCERARRATPGP